MSKFSLPLHLLLYDSPNSPFSTHNFCTIIFLAQTVESRALKLRGIKTNNNLHIKVHTSEYAPAFNNKLYARFLLVIHRTLYTSKDCMELNP